VADGRKETIVRPPPFCGRDHERGWAFFLKEWPAARAEKWIIRFGLALTRNSNVQIPMQWSGIGWQGVGILFFNGILAGGVQAAEAIPIYDELLECVSIIRDPKARDKATGGPVISPIVSDDDIQEVVTRGWLRDEVFKLHAGFSVADALSKYFSTAGSRPVSPSTIQTSLPESPFASPETRDSSGP
jgi:hypothetical protein